MPGEVEKFEAAVKNARVLEERLARTSEPSERRVLNEQLVVAKERMVRGVWSLKEAAKRGDRRAREFLEDLEKLLGRNEDK